MKKILLLALLGFPFIANAQLIAGLAPGGTQIVQLNHTITAPNYSRDSVEIDLDCNSVLDIKFLLLTGNPTIDGPHSVYATSSDTTFKLCAINSSAPFGTSYLNSMTQ